MKNKKGISLIVLIITIVVIVILATAIIVNIAKTNIIENSNEAVVKQDFKTMQEELDMYIADLFASSKGALDITTVDARTEDDVKEILKSSSKSKYIKYVKIIDGKIVINKEVPSDIKEWASEVINEGIKTPVIQVGTEVTNANSSITGEKFSSTNPVIPVGFKAKETTAAAWADSNDDGIIDGWNNGLVIADAIGNEFVWVPCTINGSNGTIKYVKNIAYPSWYGATTENTVDDLDALPMGNGTTRINETEQIKKYGGFYIARYEAGVPANQTAIDGVSRDTSDKVGIPVIQQGATVWTFISYNQAVQNAKKLYEKSSSVRCSIPTGTAWDTVCTWIQSETDLEGKAIHDVTNSISWGNYKDDPVDGDNGKKTTGFSETWKAKNIYDIAGNTWEWIGEISSTFFRVGRGGFCTSNGSEGPAAHRGQYDPNDPIDLISFRTMLFVM